MTADRLVSVDTNLDFPAAVAARLAAQVANPATPFGKAANTANNIVSAAQQTGLDSTGGTVVSSILQAGLNATPDGWTFLIPPGTYNLGTTGLVVSKGIHILGQGAKFVYYGTGDALTLKGGMETIYPVSAITTGTQPMDGYDLPTVELTVTGTPPWEVGDVVKLVADDQIAGGRAASDPAKVERAGQHLTVHSVTAGKVILLGKLYDPYTTNIRVARFKKVTTTVTGLTLTADPATVLTQKSRMLVFSELQYPVADNVVIEKCAGGGITFSGCYGAVANNCKVNQNSNDPSLSLFGYGLSESSSTYTHIIGGTVGYVRHGYTDNTSQIVTNASFEGYGRTVGATLNGVSSYSSGGSSFDTHTLSRQATFRGCKSFDAGSASFALRGHKHQVLDGYSFQARDGLLIFSEGDSDSFHHHIDGLVVESPREHAVVSYLKNTSFTRETRHSTIKSLEVINAPADAFYIRRGTMEFGKVSVRTTGNYNAGDAQFHLGDADVTVDTLDVNFTGITGSATGLGVAKFDTGNTSRFRPRNVYITFGSQATADRFDFFALMTTACTVQGRADVDYWTQGKHFMPWTTTSTDTAVNWKATNQPLAWSSLHIQISNTTNITPIAALGRQTEPRTTLPCNVQAAWTLPTILPGRFMGQVITIAHTNGAGTMTITNGSNITTKTGANLSMVIGDSIDIFWTGTTWRQIR